MSGKGAAHELCFCLVCWEFSTAEFPRARNRPDTIAGSLSRWQFNPTQRLRPHLKL